ncbi:hypothetical protein Q1695_008182 [Nippostrongylus brasiliensis]|nr:hypothetical protein Q1695_008182 [Nippostrongylus brasiliensis]
MAPFYAKCVECGVGPIELDTLRVHLRDVHKWTEEQIEAEQTKLKEKGSVEQKMMSCDKCDRVFRLEHNLRAHRQKAHGGAPRLPGSYVVCSNCHKKCVDALELTTHWRKEHAGESMTLPTHRPVVKVDVKPGSSGLGNATRVRVKRPRHKWVNDTRTNEEVLEEKEKRRLERLHARAMRERERRLKKAQKNESNIGREQLLAQDNGQRASTMGDVLATAKRLIASKKDGSSPEKRPMLYAIVGIESADRMKRFVDLTANNSFDNVMFFDASLVNKMCCDNDSDIKQEKTSAMGSSSQMEVSDSRVFDTVKKENLDCPESTDSMNDEQGICILNILPSRDDLPTTSEERSSSSETRAESRSRSRRSDDACADISKESDWTSCLVCGVYRTSEETRFSSLERSQNLMLFASLLAQNLIETDEAVRMYKETINSQQFICHDHFIQAAAHIGKDVEDMCGEFPKNGLVEVPPSIKSDILAYLRLNAAPLDEEAVLEADDATRFFYENLMRYYGKDGWQSRDTSQNDLQTFEDASTYIDDQPETDSAIKTEALDANESSYFSASKIEIGDTNGISVMDLLCDIPTEECDTLDEPTTSVASQEVTFLPQQPEDNESENLPTEEQSLSMSMRIVRDTDSVDTLDDDEFWFRFRITRPTFKILCDTIDVLRHDPDLELDCATATGLSSVLDILAGNTTALNEGDFCYTKAGHLFNCVLALLAEWSTKMIQWPDDKEQQWISANFFELFGLDSVVGCIDGTVVHGTQNLNVGMVADHKKRFRWVLAKFHSEENDDWVFKHSILYQQMKFGRRKGRLIGDNAYSKSEFLLTPDMGTETSSSVKKAHSTVVDAIADLRRQFPILNENIRYPRVARIVICCAALYNLSRSYNEPVFIAPETQCVTID